MQPATYDTACSSAPPKAIAYLKVALLASVALLTSCSDSDSDPVAQDNSTADMEGLNPTPPASPGIDPLPQGPTTEQVNQARFRLSFDAQWSAQTFPLNFPGNPHFSGLVGAVHNEQVRFWEPAQIATPGIQLMAETGGKSILLDEVQAAIDSGTALTAIDGSGLGTSPGTSSIEFTVTRDYPEISVTSMLAPSPDWFIGLHNFSLLENGEFLTSRTVDLILYDSGSDEGLRYTSLNAPSDPLEPIARVSSEAQDAPFINGLPSVGTFTIQQMPAIPLP